MNTGYGGGRQCSYEVAASVRLNHPRTHLSVHHRGHAPGQGRRPPLLHERREDETLVAGQRDGTEPVGGARQRRGEEVQGAGQVLEREGDRPPVQAVEEKIARPQSRGRRVDLEDVLVQERAGGVQALGGQADLCGRAFV